MSVLDSCRGGRREAGGGIVSAMTLEIAVVLLILLGAIVLFVTEWLRMDLVALLVLVAVAVTGYVTPTEAVSGFSNPAVITVWAMFIISGGLTVTGVAGTLGNRLSRIAGDGETRLIVAVMVTAGVLSAVMNNVGVAAMMLPVVVDISKRSGHPPSRLLLPLALGSLLGGLTTMIGTPPNILVADITRDLGLEPFRLFDFTPIGVLILIAGTAFVALVGRHLLPRRDPLGDTRERSAAALFDLDERLLTIPIPADSPLAGMTLASSRLGAALGITVVAIDRAGRVVAAPGRDTVLRPGDRLLALGHPDLLDEVRHVVMSAAEDAPTVPTLSLVEALVLDGSPLAGSTLMQSAARPRHRLDVLGVRRDDTAQLGDLSRWRVQPGDILLLAGTPDSEVEVPEEAGLSVLGAVPADDPYGLDERLMSLTVPDDSSIAGRTLAESRLRDRLGLAVWEIRRADEVIPLPGPDVRVEIGDVLVALATPSDLALLTALGDLHTEAHTVPDSRGFESRDVGLAEIVLSPQTTLEGKTLRELEFRDRYGLTVLAVWRQGRAYRTGLRDMELRFGDAILAHGSREQLRLLGLDPDFVVASEPAPPPPRREKAPTAMLILVAVVGVAISGLLPISVAAVGGASAMVLTKCMSMEDGYRFIEWQAVFLIAGMLPLGLAMEHTGAARFLAEGVVTLVGPFGPLAVMAGVYLMTALATQVVPTAALVVLMAPIAYTSAVDLGVSPLPFLMTLAIAASASFSSPVSHPANTLVMGPGGYRFVDYVKVGLPLTGIVFAITMVMVPIFWPF
jgi:di/tricarboxylate transporter